MNGVRATGIAVAFTSLSNLPVWIFTGLAPSIAISLQFDGIGLGAAVASFFSVAALCALPAGRILEHIGWRRGVVTAACIVALSLSGMGLASAFPTMIGFLILGAIGFAFAQVCSNVALAETVSPGRQGTAFGLKQAALPLTTLMVGASVPLFLWPGGWRWAFGSAAALTVLFLVIVLTLVLADRAPRQGPDTVLPRIRRRRRRPKVAHHTPPPPLLMLAAGAGLGSAATASIGGFLVVFGVSTGLTPAAAGRLLAIGSIICLVSRLLTGWFADRRGRGHLRVVGLMMLSGSLGFVLLAVADRPWLVIAGTSLAFGLGWAWNGLFAFAVVKNHSGYPATATGVVQTAMGAGSAGGPLLFGVVVALVSYSAAWGGVALALASGAVLILQGRRMLGQQATAG